MGIFDRTERRRRRSGRSLRRHVGAALAVIMATSAAATSTAGAFPPGDTPLPVVTASGRFLPGDSCFVREGAACVNVPEPLTIIQGTRLELTNLDIPRHDLRSESIHPETRRPLFASRVLSPGETEEVFRVAELEPGTYRYYCTLHPPSADGSGMRGLLRVIEGPAA